MFVAKKHIARRSFLRGAGVTLALPLLESMVPALTPARLTAAAPVRRFVGIWHPHGAAPLLPPPPPADAETAATPRLRGPCVDERRDRRGLTRDLRFHQHGTLLIDHAHACLFIRHVTAVESVTLPATVTEASLVT